MTDQQRHLSSDEITDRAGELARHNPDAARSIIDKIENAVDHATGGKFSDAIDKGGDALESALALPNNDGGASPAPADPANPSPQPPGEEPATPEPPTDPAPLPPTDGQAAPPRLDPRE